MGNESEQPSENVNDATRRNFDMLLRHMRDPDTAESVGGNAFRRIVDGITYSCYAINGIMDRRTLEVRQYGNEMRLLEDEEVAFSLVFGIPPPNLMLRGHSDALLDACSGEINGTLDARCRDALMTMKPFYDGHMANEYASFLGRYSQEKPQTLLQGIRDKFRRLFGA